MWFISRFFADDTAGLEARKSPCVPLFLDQWRWYGAYIETMCGRIIQASGPLRYQLVDGLDVPDSRLSNIPRRYNGAPSQELLVIRQNHATGERSRSAHIRLAFTVPCRSNKGRAR